ncbi:hypothetical protein L4D04_23720 [Photobacterium angustum]|uniref:hypothetical protein n=2 Tax=Photobacterium angustum TaxID=661 RepID=UPI003D0C686A
MRLENYKYEQISLKNKVGFIFITLLLSAGCFWFISSWITSLFNAYSLTNIITYSVSTPLVGISLFGVVVWLWLAMFIIIKTNKVAAHSWTKTQKEQHNKMLILCCAIAVIISAISYFYIDNRLINHGYSVTTKVTNVNIYKTYTKN